MENKSKSILSIVLGLIGLFSFFYLTNSYYNLLFSTGSGQSICNINSFFNCDTTSASPFAKLFNIPMALWGASTYIVFLVLFVSHYLSESKRLLRYSFYLSAFILAVSLFMASVSILLVGAICLFCTLTYLCSAGIFFLCWQLNEDKFAKLKDDMIDIFQNSKEVSILVVMIPVLSFLIHSSIASEKLGQIKELSRYGIEQWEFAPSKQFDQSPSFTIGVETSSAKMRIVEFADYMCIHCKQASPVLKAFVSAHPDVSLSFYNFPLDGRCNSAIEQAGRSCDLAKASVCAEMKWKKGSLASEFLFAQFGSVDASNVSEKLAKELSVDSKELQSCIDSEESLRLVKMQADLGNRVNVKGTPSIFINERPLQGGAMLPVLEAVYKKINNQ